ncbi:MAG TPA: hypothetical protein VF794_28280 [Archangium sp.]|uniref:hypothetical protein n=1 Tax=Archangium sp. TaxID=1872627 RepID=UPI002ED807C4
MRRSPIPFLMLSAALASSCGLPDEETSPALSTTAQAVTPVQLSYVVFPHPDDEYEGWALVDNSTSNYKVFVMMTRGEETSGCLPASAAVGGPHWYEGPNSPVGRPDYNERMPVPNPWSGKWTSACKQARVESFRTFLETMAASDVSLPRAPTSRGRFCFGGMPSDGLAPTVVDYTDANGNGGVASESRCADVWSNSVGAIVMFDLGDGDLRPAEVIWALQQVRANKAQLGIPALPELNVIGASYYNTQYTNCATYGHTDHRAIHTALWNTNLGAGPQYVRTCTSDPDITNTGGRISSVSDATHARTFQMSGNTRLGPNPRIYGWLNVPNVIPTTSDSLYGQRQGFWKR